MWPVFFLSQTYTIFLGYSVQALVVVALRDLIEDSEREIEGGPQVRILVG